jgi:glycosyltransferase involved in cell wall biosynthesis
MEISVVIPCLNEADTLEQCVLRAKQGIAESGVEGEVVVADNGSTDGSVAIAERAGARVVPVVLKGYGNALMGGIAAARGKFVVMGDADMSYDFHQVPRFHAKWREGFELVQGCRLPAGGGTVMPGAMPFLHRWLGNPLFSWMVRLMFRAPIHDVYCGMRGFTPELYRRLEQRCTGMEFAVEMLIKAALLRSRIAEVPITLHPDRRVSHAPHLRTWRDGWRTLRFLLLSSPRWLYLVPGLALVALGALGYALALPGFRVFGAALDAHTLLFASLALLCGHQSMLFGLFAKTFAITEGILPPSASLDRFWKFANLERGILLSLLAIALGVALLAVAVVQWAQADFGRLDYARTMRWVIPGVTAVALGFQTLLASFFVSMLGLARK